MGQRSNGWKGSARAVPKGLCISKVRFAQGKVGGKGAQRISKGGGMGRERSGKDDEEWDVWDFWDVWDVPRFRDVEREVRDEWCGAQ